LDSDEKQRKEGASARIDREKETEKKKQQRRAFVDD